MKKALICVVLVLLSALLLAACTENKQNDTQRTEPSASDPAPTASVETRPETEPLGPTGQTQGTEPSVPDTQPEPTVTEPDDGEYPEEGGLTVNEDIVIEVTGNVNFGGN